MMVLLDYQFWCGLLEIGFIVFEQVIEGSFWIGGQEYFYLEGQIVMVQLQEVGGMLVYFFIQYLIEIQYIVVKVLGVLDVFVMVEVWWMGGGFGGKEFQVN